MNASLLRSIKAFVPRFGYIVVMMVLISMISFLAIHAAPNSFLSAGGLNPNMTPEVIDRLKAVYGLDKPLFQQYTSWVNSLLHLDFGISFVYGTSVFEEIAKRINITLFMNLVTLVAVFALSLSLGIKAALKSETRTDKTIKQLSLVSFSMPSFYLSLLLILFFSVWMEVTPIAGLHAPGIDESQTIAYYGDYAWHLILPLSVMIFVSIGSMTMYVRSLTIQILKSDHISFAKARDLPQKVIIRRYILPNLMPPVVTLLGLSLPGLIGGSVILEKIFAIDGMGLLFFNAALSRDYPVIMGVLIITAFLTLIGNTVADLILVRLNPFFKHSKR